MRLIDADTAAAFAENCGATFVAKRLRDSNAFPEAVTRCKDCAYGDPTWAGYVCNCNEYAALESTLYHEEDFFCSYGEPKEGNN